MLSFAAHYVADSGGEIREENTLTPRKVSIFPDGRNAVITLVVYFGAQDEEDLFEASGAKQTRAGGTGAGPK
jgi:hypothetical protein